MDYVIYLLDDHAHHLANCQPDESTAAQVNELNEAIAILKQHATRVPSAPPELVRDYPNASD